MELTKEYFELHLNKGLEKLSNKVNTDIENLATLVAKGFENTVVKDDITNFITKEDALNFATKDDLLNFATKDDLLNFATKDDLLNFATKDDMAEIKIDLLEIKDSLKNLDKRTNEDSIAIIKDIIYLNKEVKLLKSTR